MLREPFFQKLEHFLEEQGRFVLKDDLSFSHEKKSTGGKMGDKLLSFIGLEPEEEELSEEYYEEDQGMRAFVSTRREATFSEKLFLYLDKKRMIDAYVYKKAGIDRRHFSKIRARDYHPGKSTAILLGLALELNLCEMEDFLGAAGYSLSKSDTADLIIEFCILHHVYNITDVNLALDRFGQKALGGGGNRG